MDTRDSFLTTRSPTAIRPLLGLTILAVEDSRFSCEAMRLLCLRSGARIRRANSLQAAHRHLQVYRPSVIIIDIGLPDGSGGDLIEELNRAIPRINVILGTSGDDNAEHTAMLAGADGFLNKPIVSLAQFQETVLSYLPADHQPSGPRKLNDQAIRPDPLAYRDDMALVADILSEDPDGSTLEYVAQFVSSVARSANDAALLNAGTALVEAQRDRVPARNILSEVTGLVRERLSQQVAI